MPYNDTRGNWSQRNQRAEMTFQDQHDREYYASIELKTGDPTGLIEPLYRAPLMPPQKYLARRNKRRPYDIDVDYVAWKRDVRTARRVWEKEGRQLAQKMHGSKYDPREEFSQEVLDVIGPPPEAIEPIIAAEQGNRWVLGLSKKVDLRLVKFFEPEDVDPDYSDREDRDEERENFAGDRPAPTKHIEGRVGRRVDPDEEEEVADPAATGGRPRNPRAVKPESRAATKGTGEKKRSHHAKPKVQPFGKEGVLVDKGHAVLDEDQQKARSAARATRKERELAEV